MATHTDARLLLDLGIVEGADSTASKLGAGAVGSSWFILLQHAQNGNILGHLASRRVDRTEFVMALLDSLDDPNRSDSIHAQTVQLLAEWGVVLLADPVDIPMVISRLISKCTTMMSDRMNLKSKLISAVTTLVLTHDYVEKDLQRFINLNMLTVLAWEDVVETAMLRRIVCHCLTDLELAMPGLLSHKLGHIHRLAQAQTTFAAQAYVQLLGVVLKNACAALRIQSKQRWRSQVLDRVPSDLVASHRLSFASLMSTEEEPLTPFFFPPEVLDDPLCLQTLLPATSFHRHSQQHQQRRREQASRSAPVTPRRKKSGQQHQPTAIQASERDGHADKGSSPAAVEHEPSAHISSLSGAMHILRTAPVVEPRQTGEDAIQRCVSFVASAAANATAPCVAHIMHALAAVLVQTSLSNQVFHVVIKRLEVSVDHCDAHTLLMLLSLFGNRRLLRTKEIISIRVRFLDLATDPCIPKWRRQLLFSLCFSDRSLLGKHKTVEDFFPHEFESLQLWSRKTDMLATVIGAQVLSRLDADTRSECSDSRSTVTDTSLRNEVLADTGRLSFMSTTQCLSTLRCALDCFQSYMFADRNGTSLGAREFFAAVYRILILAPPPVAKDVADHLLHLSATQPAFLPLLVNTITAVSETLQNTSLAVDIFNQLLDRFVATDAHELMQHIDEHLVLLLRLAQVDAIQPAPFLLKVKEVLASTPLCRQGDWNRGDRLLQICRCVMQREASEATTLLPLGDVLTTVWQNFRNIDIQDLARLLYMLLVKVSGGLLAGILDMSLDALQQDRIQDFLPSEEVDRSFKDQEKVHRAKHQLLLLKRVKPKQVRRRETKPRLHARKPSSTSLERLVMGQSSSEAPPEDTPLEVPSIPVDSGLLGHLDAQRVLKEYARHLQANMHKASVRIPCRLSYEVSAGVAKIVKCPEKVFAVQLTIHDDEEYFRKNDAVYVPCLRLLQRTSVSGSGDNTSHNSASIATSSESFWDFDLPCQPIEPRPVQLHANVTYTDDNGVSWTGAVDDISISFSDLLQKPSLPVAWLRSDEGQGLSREALQVNAYREALFASLWHHMEDHKCASGLVSSKNLDMPAPTAVAFLKQLFQTFLVASDRHVLGNQLARLRFLIFVPPQFHLLLDCRIMPARTLVHIASDHPQSASHLERFLHDEAASFASTR